MKKLLAILMIAAMAVPSLVACSSEGGAPAGTTAADTAAQAGETTAVADAETEINRESAISTLDDSLDFGGATINIGYTGSQRYATDVIGADDGDVINESIYERNLNVEEDLGIKLNMIKIAESTTAATNQMRTVVMAGDSVYDICSTHQSYTAKLLFDNIFYNLADNE
nr:hypothetical protein [Clostridia bacterium]